MRELWSSIVISPMQAHESISIMAEGEDITVLKIKKYGTGLTQVCNSVEGSWGGAVVRALASHQCVPSYVG